MQRGSICNEGQDASRIKMQRGSRYNQDKDDARINMQRGHIVLRGPLSFALFTLSSVTNIITFSPRLLIREAIARKKANYEIFLQTGGGGGVNRILYLLFRNTYGSDSAGKFFGVPCSTPVLALFSHFWVKNRALMRHQV